YRNALRGMAGRFEHAQGDAAEVEFIAIVDGAMRESRAGPVPEHNVRPGAGREFPMAADKIGVQMRFNDIFDLQTLGGGFTEILLYIALWIYHRGLAVSPNEIRRMGQTSQIKLLEIHGVAPCSPRTHDSGQTVARQ